MDVALKRINDEGIENVFARHAALGNFTRKGIKSLGLSILPNEGVASNTVTAVAVPEDFDITRFRKILRDEHDVVVAGGQGALQNKIFRIGHLGYVVESDIRIALKAIGATLGSFGFHSKAGTT
jgi:aspartate aminotransferase-like enzyme